MRELVKLFGWPPELTQRTVAWLVQNGRLVKDGLAHPQGKRRMAGLAGIDRSGLIE